MRTTFDFALNTDPGLVRPLNEDAMGADAEAGLFILADGLGGYNAGEIASTMAVSTLLAELTEAQHTAREAGDIFDPARVLRDALVVMNANIFRAALNSTAFEGMATTVVVAWLIGDILWVAHTGDSRLYRHRNGELEQLTRDHSFSQELLDAGMVTEEEARLLPAKNLVTRALGASPDIEPEVHPYDLEPGDVLLLCSDGLTEMVTHYEIDGLINACDEDLADAARRLVDMANEAGGRDNTSVILVRVGDVVAEETIEELTEVLTERPIQEQQAPTDEPTEDPTKDLTEEPAKEPAQELAEELDEEFDEELAENPAAATSETTAAEVEANPRPGADADDGLAPLSPSGEAGEPHDGHQAQGPQTDRHPTDRHQIDNHQTDNRQAADNSHGQTSGSSKPADAKPSSTPTSTPPSTVALATSGPTGRIS